MKKRIIAAAVSVTVATVIAGCDINVNVNPDNVEASPVPIVVNTTEPEPSPEPSAEPEPSPEPLIDTDNNNETSTAKDPKTVPIPYEYGSLVDNALFVSYDDELCEVTKYKFFYADENLYYEETWGGVSEEDDYEYVMSWHAGEVFVPDEDNIEYSNGKLTITCIIKRFSSFSNAGMYWDEGKDAVITFDSNEVKIEFLDGETEGYKGTLDKENELYYGEEFSEEMVNEMFPGTKICSNMEFINDWWCDEGDVHHYIKMYPLGEIVFLTKRPGEPVELSNGIWMWDKYDDENDMHMHIYSLTSNIGTANYPIDNSYYIWIYGDEFHVVPADEYEAGNQDAGKIYQSKWFVSGRQCPIDYFSL